MICHRAESCATNRRTMVAPIRVSGDRFLCSRFALDLTEGQPIGHSIRSCIFGMHIAQEIGLPLNEQADLSLRVADEGRGLQHERIENVSDSRHRRHSGQARRQDQGPGSKRSAGSRSNTLYPTSVRAHRSCWAGACAVADLAVHHKKNSQEMVQIRCERRSLHCSEDRFARSCRGGHSQPGRALERRPATRKG